MHRLGLIRQGFPDRAAFDIAVSTALLRRAATQQVETLRLHVPGPALAFGARDRNSAGYPAAITRAAEIGFPPVRRLAGGKAAVFHAGTLAFSWAVPEADARQGIERRFILMAQTVTKTLRSLGIDARVGEVPGEYCPGRFSVNAGGATKLMGVGQRLIRGGAHLGGVLVVDGSQQVRAALTPVYAALGYEWDPATVGSVADELGRAVSNHEIADALLGELGNAFEMSEQSLDGEVLASAEQLAPEHEAEVPVDTSASAGG